MTERLPTPGFFTSALGLYDSSNPFESEFKDAEDHRRQQQLFNTNDNDDFFGFSPRTSPVPDGPKVQVPLPVFQPQDLDGMDLGSPNGWNPSKQMFTLDPQNFQQSPARTPFASAKEWNLDPSLRQPTTLDKIITQDIDSNIKIQHGQITPPSDATPASEASVHDQDSQANSKSTSKAKTGGRRKRSTQTRQSVDSTSSRRCKSSSASRSVVSDVQDHEEEVDEKRSKFLERNRVAASKCRQKKKEWTNNLEQRARELQQNKTQLALMVGSLKEEMLFLKGEVLKHNNCNCTTMRDYLNREVQSISQQMPHVHGLPVSMGPNMSGPPGVDGMEVDHLGHRSPPSTRDDSMSVALPVDDHELKALLTSEIQPSQ